MYDSFDDLDTGWSWLVMWAGFSSLFVIGGANYSVGLIHTAMLEKFHRNQATTAWVGALYTALMNLGGPLSSYIMDRYSSRTAVISSGILFTAGFMATAYAPSVEVAIFTCGIVAGLGGAIGWTASMCFICFYFRKYRNIAQGFALSGTGAGIFALPPSMQLGKVNFGYPGLFVVLACFSIHMVVFGSVLRPSKLERHVHQKRTNKHNNTSDGKMSASLLRVYLRIFSTRIVILMSLSMFMKCFGLYIILLYLPNYCMQNGSKEMQASFVISASGIASIFGRILTGFAANCDRINEICIHSGSIGIMSLLTVLFPVFAHTYTGQLAYAILLGCVFGSPYVTLMPINVSFLGVSNMGAALGIELGFCGLGGFLGPPLAGFVLDRGGTYEHIFFIAAAFLAFGSLLGMLVFIFGKRPQGNTSSSLDIDVGSGEATTKMVDNQNA